MNSAACKSTGKLLFGLCQAALIGVAITNNEEQTSFGMPTPYWLVGVAIVCYIAGYLFISSADNKERLERHLRGKRHRIRIPKNTTLTVEVENANS